MLHCDEAWTPMLWMIMLWLSIEVLFFEPKVLYRAKIEGQSLAAFG